MKQFLLAAGLALLSLIAVPAKATTYYVSTSGLDTNPGTSESAPWAHVPGMPTASGTAKSHSVVAGDTFVLRGCDVWYNSNFPLTLSKGGVSGNPVVMNVDQTWYNTTSCSTWNRPIFDAHTSASSSTPTQIGGTTFGCVSGGNFFVSISASYININWLEMRNLYYANNAENTCYNNNGWYRINSADFVNVSNGYEHGWSMGPFSSTVNDADELVAISGSPACPHCLLTKNVANNCATTSGPGTLPGGALSFPNVTYSVYACMANNYKPLYGGEFGWNEIRGAGPSPDTTIHPNCIESVAAQGSPIYYIHDNRIHDNYECEGLQIGNPGETDYVWNNSWYNLLGVGANGPQVPQSETPVGMHFFNNNVVGWGDCINDASHGYSWSGPFSSQNNLCINSAGNAGSGSPSANPVTITNNVGLTISAATSAGYTNAQQFPYSPTKSTSPSVGKGVNLTSSMPAGFAIQDSSIICTDMTVNTVVQVVCTGTPNPRPATGAWDVGSYQFGSTGTLPAPPTNVRITGVQ